MPYIKASNTRRSQAITDIIESIALEETGLAHILNAEGEVLQKVLCIHDLKEEGVIAVNKSLVEVLKAVADLEHELHEKLEIFKHCACDHYIQDDENFDCEENA